MRLTFERARTLHTIDTYLFGIMDDYNDHLQAAFAHYPGQRMDVIGAWARRAMKKATRAPC